MSNLNVSHEQIKQLAMDWYNAIMEEIRAEQSILGEEVTAESTQSSQKEVNTNAA